MQGKQNIVEGDTGDPQGDGEHFSDCEVVSYFTEHDCVAHTSITMVTNCWDERRKEVGIFIISLWKTDQKLWVT